jgi:hypothetical protein
MMLLDYNLMGPPSYIRSIVDWNVMWCMTVLLHLALKGRTALMPEFQDILAVPITIVPFESTIYDGIKLVLCLCHLFWICPEYLSGPLDTAQTREISLSGHFSTSHLSWQLSPGVGWEWAFSLLLLSWCHYFWQPWKEKKMNRLQNFH